MGLELKQHFQSMAAYNRSVNVELYEAVGRLDRTEFEKPREAFFGSIMATLNHILLCDRLWFGRITGVPYAEAKSLDQILHVSYDALASARREDDLEIIRIVDGLDADRLTDTQAYGTLDGAQHTATPAQMLTCVFNHQTHHRGQVHDMLSQTTVAPPSIDYFHERADGTFGPRT